MTSTSRTIVRTGPVTDAVDETLVELLDRQARERPDQAAIVRVTGDGDGEALTYARLRGEALALAGWLRDEAGLRTGDRVGIFLDNASVLEFYTAIAACWTGGMVATPMNARLAAPELEFQLRHSGARVLVTSQAFRVTATAALRGAPATKLVLDVDAGGDWTGPSVGFRAAIDAGGRHEVPRPDPETACALVFTSGTTGRPKAALFQHHACVAHGNLVGQGLRLHPGGSVMLAVPVYTSTGIHTFPLPCLTWGTTMYYEAAFDAERWAARVRRLEPTTYFGVPSMLALVLDATPADDLAGLRSIAHVMFGGSPMPRPLADRLVAAFPGLSLWNLYGLTEAGPGGTALRPEDAMEHLSTVGRALPGMEIRVTGPDRAVLPAGEEGEVAIRTPSRMTAYFDDPEATAATIDADGWLHTGDVGRLDGDGFLTLLDRKNDMIVRGGFNVYPAEVEQALLAHPSVLEAAVVGTPHRVLGEDVVGCVVLRPGAEATAAELTAFCRERVADYKSPRTIRFLDGLPRNAMGKVLRRELRTPAVEATPSDASA